MSQHDSANEKEQIAVSLMQRRRPSARVMVYDPSARTVDDHGSWGTFKPTPDMIETYAPGRGLEVDIWLNVGPEEHKIKSKLATVALPNEVRWQRLRGNIRSIFVKGNQGPQHVSGYWPPNVAL